MSSPQPPHSLFGTYLCLRINSFSLMVSACCCEVVRSKKSRLSFVLGVVGWLSKCIWSRFGPLMRSRRVAHPRKILSSNVGETRASTLAVCPRILDIECSQAGCLPLTSFSVSKLPIYGEDGQPLAYGHAGCYYCFHAARVWVHIGAELTKL